MSRVSSDGTRKSAGFSLVEMLMVVGIIALLIALLLPALNNARNTALEVRTTAMATDLTNAAQRFGNDNAGRNPGYFTERQMGAKSNWDSNNTPQVGMSAMENAILELCGTGVVLGRESNPDVEALIAPENGIISLGPANDPNMRVVVNLAKIGGEGAYYVPDPNTFKAQFHGPPDQQQAGNAQTFGEGQELMPDVLDAWGRPMLVWAQDPMARGEIVVESGADPDTVYSQFVQVDSDEGAAWFYLASNAAFLESRGFDDGNISMVGDPASGRTSTIGGGIDDMERIRTLAVALASPGSYIVDPSVDGIANATFDQIFPSRPRGRFIVQSAGRDGYFMSSFDDGWNTNANTDGAAYHLDFGNNFYTQGGERITDRNGASSNINMVDDFDDVFVGSK